MAPGHSKRRARIAPARLAAALLLAFGLIPGAARANGPEIGRDGSSIFPVASRTIQLLHEDVHIVLPRNGGAGRVSARYTLKNRSRKSQSFEMSFVIGQPGLEGSTWRSEDAPRVATEAGGVQVRWRPLKPGAWNAFVSEATDSLPTWSVSIAAGATQDVSIDYPASWSGFGDGADWAAHYTYCTRPAALWAGPIELAEFTINPGEYGDLLRGSDPWAHACAPPTVEPPGSFWNGDCLHWRFENWEPDADIRIRVECIEPTPMADYFETMNADPQGRVHREIELPAYRCDQEVLDRTRLLEELRAAFVGHDPQHAILPDYIPYAQAWLLLRRSEISARHGGRFQDAMVARYFNSYGWYRDMPASAAPVLNATEIANQALLADLAREIAASHDVLLPLPKPEPH